MFTHRSQPSFSLLVMCVVTQALVTRTYSMTNCSILSKAPDSLRCRVCTNQALQNARNYDLSSQQAWSQIGTQLSQSQKDGICNLLALRDVAERAQGTGTATAISSSLELLEQNVEDACKVVFADSNPDRDNCKDVLRYNCFLDRASGLALEKICSVFGV